MIKSGIDQDAIVKLFSEATAKQGEALRKAVSDATLKALQGRELSMENIKKVLKTVTTAATAGAARTPGLHKPPRPIRIHLPADVDHRGRGRGDAARESRWWDRAVVRLGRETPGRKRGRAPRRTGSASIPRTDRRPIRARHCLAAGRRTQVLPGEWHGG